MYDLSANLLYTYSDQLLRLKAKQKKLNLRTVTNKFLKQLGSRNVRMSP
jgi:hypothetical protein